MAKLPSEITLPDEGKHGVTKAESKMAQELAMELAMGVDVKKDKAKKQTG